jgi:Tfp pilus assembly protein PilF
MKQVSTLVLLCMLGMAPMACSKSTPENSAKVRADAAAAPSGASPATDLIAKGVKELDAGQIKDAVATFKQATEKDPRSADAQLKLAGAHMADQDFESSIACFKKAIGLNPGNSKGFIGLGIAYMHGGDDSLAQAAFEEALRLDPSREAQIKPILDKLQAENAMPFQHGTSQ